MNRAMTTYVLDTSAWLTFIEDETGVEIVQKVLEEADAGESEVLTSFMSFMEVYYITQQERGIKHRQQRLHREGVCPGAQTHRPAGALADSRRRAAGVVLG